MATAVTPVRKKAPWRDYIMRTSGPQQFYAFPFAVNSLFVVPKPVPLDLPLAYLHISWKGRIVIGTANYASVYPESLLNVLTNIRLNGTHSVLGNINTFNTSFANLFKLAKLMRIRGNSVYVNGVRLSDDTLSNGIPIATFGNTGTYDIDIELTIPVFPLGINDGQAILYLYNAAHWSQLQMYLQQGDATCFGVLAGGTTVAFSAFGSNAGAPLVQLAATYVQLGDYKGSVAQAVRVLNDIPINSVLQSNATAIRLAQLQNQKTTAVVVKTGTAFAAASGIVFATLSDSILEQTQIKLNNAPLRNLIQNSITKEFYGMRQDTVQPIGYLGILFDDGSPNTNAWTAMKGQNFNPSAVFEVDSNVVGAAGTNTGDILQEYILGDPVVAAA